MAQLAMHSPRLALGWDLGRQLGTRCEGGGGLTLHRWTSSTRSLRQRLPHFCALPVLRPFNIYLFFLSPEHGSASAHVPYLWGHNWQEVPGSSEWSLRWHFPYWACLSPRQTQSWFCPHRSTSCVTSGKGMETLSPGLPGGDNYSLSGWLWGVGEVMQVSYAQHVFGTHSLPSSRLGLFSAFYGLEESRV